MRPIDADALLKSAGIFEVKMGARGCGKSILHLAKAWLFNEVNKAPTIDAVPVVRCEECKWWMHMEEGMGDCTNRRFRLDGQADPTMKADDFCSCGERRDDNE